MKYVFKDNIKKEDYDNFVKNFPSTTFMQTSSWSLVKRISEEIYTFSHISSSSLLALNLSNSSSSK